MPGAGIKRKLNNHGGLTNQAEIPTWLEKPTSQETVRSLENMWEKYDACLLCSHSVIHLESWTRCWARRVALPRAVTAILQTYHTPEEICSTEQHPESHSY